MQQCIFNAKEPSQRCPKVSYKVFLNRKSQVHRFASRDLKSHVKSVQK